MSSPVLLASPLFPAQESTGAAAPGAQDSSGPSTTAPTATTAETGDPAGDAPKRSSPFDSFLIPMILIMVVFYFVMIGPERKQRKKREEMLKKLGKGDRVMTQGGLYGQVAAVADDVVTLQVADGVRMRFARSAIQVVLEAEGAEPEKEAAKKA